MLKPLADRVLIEVKEEETKTKGGILLPDTAQKKSQKGTVVAVGQGIPMEVKVGDEVLFAKYSGTDIDEGGKHYLLITERDILCVF